MFTYLLALIAFGCITIYFRLLRDLPLSRLDGATPWAIGFFLSAIWALSRLPPG